MIPHRRDEEGLSKPQADMEQEEEQLVRQRKSRRKKKKTEQFRTPATDEQREQLSPRQRRHRVLQVKQG